MKTATQDKIEALIAQKRAPLDAARDHIAAHDRSIQACEARASAYLADPKPETLKDAMEAEKDLAALRSLRSRLAVRDFDKELREILDRSFEAAPLLHTLADESMALLEQCRERLIEFKTARLRLPDPKPDDPIASPRYSVNRRLARFEYEIAAARNCLESIHLVIDNWAKDSEHTIKSFGPIYSRCSLSGAKLTLYADAGHIPDDQGCVGKIPSLRAPESKTPQKS